MCQILGNKNTRNHVRARWRFHGLSQHFTPPPQKKKTKKKQMHCIVILVLEKVGYTETLATTPWHPWGRANSLPGACAVWTDAVCRKSRLAWVQMWDMFEVVGGPLRVPLLRVLALVLSFALDLCVYANLDYSSNLDFFSFSTVRVPEIRWHRYVTKSSTTTVPGVW